MQSRKDAVRFEPRVSSFASSSIRQNSLDHTRCRRWPYGGCLDGRTVRRTCPTDPPPDARTRSCPSYCPTDGMSVRLNTSLMSHVPLIVCAVRFNPKLYYLIVRRSYTVARHVTIKIKIIINYFHNRTMESANVDGSSYRLLQNKKLTAHWLAADGKSRAREETIWKNELRILSREFLFSTNIHTSLSSAENHALQWGNSFAIIRINTHQLTT